MLDANTKKELELAAGWEPSDDEPIGWRPPVGGSGLGKLEVPRLAAAIKTLVDTYAKNPDISPGLSITGKWFTHEDLAAIVAELSAPSVDDLTVSAPAADEALSGAAEAFRAEGGLVGDLTANVLDWVGIALKAGDQDRIDRLTAAMLALIGDKP